MSHFDDIGGVSDDFDNDQSASERVGGSSSFVSVRVNGAAGPYDARAEGGTLISNFSSGPVTADKVPVSGEVAGSVTMTGDFTDVWSMESNLSHNSSVEGTANVHSSAVSPPVSTIELRSGSSNVEAEFEVYGLGSGGL